MGWIALLISLLIAALGAIGAVSPDRLIGIVRRFQSPAGLYTAAGLRIVLGVSLIFAAPFSRAPEAIRIFGIAVVVAGLVTPLFGVERFGRVLDWWSARGPIVLRLWAGCALALGLLLAYAVLP